MTDKPAQIVRRTLMADPLLSLLRNQKFTRAPTYNILGQKEEGVICLKCGRANYLPMYDNQHVVIGFKQKPRGSR